MRLAAVLLVALLLAPGAAAVALPVGSQGSEGTATGGPSFPSLPSLPSAPSADGTYSLGFECPGTAQQSLAAPAECPAYVFDAEDVMAQPILVADPSVPTLVAFNALHGGRGLHPAPGDEAPTPRSRDNVVHQTHTTFLSANAGATWQDDPYHAPDALVKDGREVYGEDNAATLDAQGHLYLASLYSYRDGAGTLGATGAFHYAIGAWKSTRLDKAPNYAANVKILQPAGAVDSIFLTYDAASDVVVLLWREVPKDGAPFVQAYTTKPGEGAIWTKLDAPVATGCDSISNPLVVGGEIFVGCRQGRWSFSALDTRTGKSRLAGNATASEPHGLLVARGLEGFMVLVSSGLAADNKTPSVRLSYGEKGAAWSDGEDIAAKITQATAPLADARVTAAVYAPESGNLHLVYMEKVDAARTGAPDQADRPDYTKVLASVQAEGAFQGVTDLGTGRASRVDFSPTLTGVGTGAYDDLHDSLILTGDGKELLAYGDYGFVRYARVVEKDFLPPIVPLGANVPAIPLASAGMSPALLGVPAGLLSGAMVLRILAARRKQAVEAPSE